MVCDVATFFALIIWCIFGRWTDVDVIWCCVRMQRDLLIWYMKLIFHVHVLLFVSTAGQLAAKCNKTQKQTSTNNRSESERERINQNRRQFPFCVWKITFQRVFDHHWLHLWKSRIKIQASIVRLEQMTVRRVRECSWNERATAINGNKMSGRERAHTTNAPKPYVWPSKCADNNNARKKCKQFLIVIIEICVHVWISFVYLSVCYFIFVLFNVFVLRVLVRWKSDDCLLANVSHTRTYTVRTMERDINCAVWLINKHFGQNDSVKNAMSKCATLCVMSILICCCAACRQQSSTIHLSKHFVCF